MDPFTLAAGVSLGLALVFGRRPRRRRRREGLTPDDCYPMTWQPARVEETILKAFDTGDCDVDDIARAAASFIYPALPSGDNAFWPPPPHADDSQRCVWKRVLEAVHALGDEHGIQLCRLGDAAAATRPSTVGVSLHWDEIVDKYSAGDTPHHGYLYQVRGPGHSVWAEDGKETLSKVATAALANAFEEADLDPELALSTDSNGVRYLVRDMMILIECAPTNDAVLSSPLAELGSKGNPGSGHYAPHGRGISFHSVHAPNLVRMRAGMPMLRTVVNGGRADGAGAEHDGRGGHPPTLWIPLLNLDALREGAVSTRDMFWPDGSSTIVPPPEIMGLGKPENVAPGLWGCDSLEVP